MDPTRYTQHPDVRRLVEDLRASCADKHYSDLVDDEGRQYVDLVMEGRGVLGLALIGYTYVLEQAGLRFRRVGGTSAGSINAMLVAALGPMDREKSVRLVEIVAGLDMRGIVDGGPGVQSFVRSLVRNGATFGVMLRGLRVANRLRRTLGLNPGRSIVTMLEEALRAEGVTTNKELLARLSTLTRGIRHREGKELRPGADKGDLIIVAADVTTEIRVTFPDMADLYWEDADSVSPALFVRASMSIPVFFEPFKVHDIPQGIEAAERWARKSGYHYAVPQTCHFIDGAITSNFPIHLFHRQGVPMAPTFGVLLGLQAPRPNRITGPVALWDAIFRTSRTSLDRDFLLRHPDYRHLVATIPTGPHHWLDFDMDDEVKLDLFVRGARTAHRFLKWFDWRTYKDLRRSLAGA